MAVPGLGTGSVSPQAIIVSLPVTPRLTPSYLWFGRAAAGQACKAEQRGGVSQALGGGCAGEGVWWVELGGCCSVPQKQDGDMPGPSDGLAPVWDANAEQVRVLAAAGGAGGGSGGEWGSREGGGALVVQGWPWHCSVAAEPQGEGWGQGGDTQAHTAGTHSQDASSRTTTPPRPWGTEGIGGGHGAATAMSPRWGTGTWLNATSSLGWSGTGWDSLGALGDTQGHRGDRQPRLCCHGVNDKDKTTDTSSHPARPGWG